MGPLAGLKVIDLIYVMAGPTCTQMLADMGADVNRIEKVPGGDDSRRGVPTIDGEAASSMMVNHNKRGIVLDLNIEGGKRVKTLGLPTKLSDTAGGVRTGAPLYGQHTREILEQRGFSAPAIDALAAEGAIVLGEL
jgi:crotonobetainyl-CoA:carnitine CoA-transferase CaiB-like acyl-CoA transferase